MNKAQFIFLAFAFSACVGAYSVISSYRDLVAAEDELISAQKDYDLAQSEVRTAQERLDNLQKYGCESPAIGQGFVSCP